MTKITPLVLTFVVVAIVIVLFIAYGCHVPEDNPPGGGTTETTTPHEHTEYTLPDTGGGR